MYRLGRGFTIVELLIVIVVIGILAAITIVAFNGVQQRATNNKTMQAASSWIKAIRMHKADKGQYPMYWTCLGSGYKYGPTGSDASGIGQCRQETDTNGTIENTTFNSVMSPYLGGASPTPSFVTARDTDVHWRRGLMYTGNGGSGDMVYMQVTYLGDISCPALTGLAGTGRVLWGGNTNCTYVIGYNTEP